jgi:hypothetical protein
MLWVILISLVYLLQSEDQSVDKEDSDIKDRVRAVVDQYGDRAFKAFYSLDELRPYCIVQIDKICDMYGNNWLSPITIIENLKFEDKKILANSVAGFIESFENENKKNYVISKIINWCKADLQFTFLNEGMGIYNDNIYKAMNSVNRNNQFHSPYDYKSAESEIISNDQNDFIYCQTLNLVSGMAFSDQLKFYGDIYYQLAENGK